MQRGEDGEIGIGQVFVEIDAVEVDEINSVTAQGFFDLGTVKRVLLSADFLGEVWNGSATFEEETAQAGTSCSDDNGQVASFDECGIYGSQHLFGAADGVSAYGCERKRDVQDGEAHFKLE